MANFNLDNSDNLLKLYAFYTQDEHELIKTLQNYIKFFSGFILATIGGAVILFDKIDDPMIQNLGFVLCGFFVIGISYLGYYAAKSNYRRQLESIVKRFKIECLMDLDNLKEFSDDKYMINEPLMLKRYQESFSKYKDGTSMEFVNEKLKEGFMKVVVKFYFLTSFIGLLLVVFGGYRIILQIASKEQRVKA